LFDFVPFRTAELLAFDDAGVCTTYKQQGSTKGAGNQSAYKVQESNGDQN
jgi:hypothetical protein